MSATTAARHRVLRAILADGHISNQQDLVEALARKGHRVTQATVSRDLDAIGAEKMRRPDGTSRYVVVDDRSPFSDNSRAAARAISDFAESIVASGDLVVLKTPPGAAHLVASAIDHSDVDGVLGTIAGDDTLLVIADETIGGELVANELETLGAGT